MIENIQQDNYEISIVIPVFNSEESLRPLMNELSEALKDYSFEVILVNDKSVDESWNLIKELSEQYPQLTGINLRKNSGQDNAIICGLNYASGKYIIVMDDDLQHSPFDIPKLYSEIKKGYDAVYANFGKKKQAAWKNLGSWLNGKMAEVLIDKPKNIYLSPFKIISCEVKDEIIQFRGTFPYLDGILFMITTNISQIENVQHHKRLAGKSNFNFGRSVSIFMRLVTNFSIKPLQISSFIGILTSLSSCVLGLYFLIQYFYDKSTPQGYTSMVLILLFLGGLILMSLGILGEYVGRLFINNQNIKPFIIKETVKKTHGQNF